MKKIFIDFDGTIATQKAEYNRKIGEPIWPMINKIKEELANGNEVIIFTARASNWNDDSEKTDIENFCEKYIGKKLPITAIKEHGIDYIIDDRCIKVEKNTGKLIYNNIDF